MSNKDIDIPRFRGRFVTAVEEVKEKKDKRSRLANLGDFVEIDWYRERPRMSCDFLEPAPDVSSEVVPKESQESVLLDDLISCFLGFHGTYIVADPLTSSNKRTFTVSPNVDPKLAELARRALSVASHYSTIVRFSQNNTMLAVGRVNQALSAAIDTVLEEYIQIILHLEKELPSLTLHTLWYRLQPFSHTMAVISDIVTKICENGCRGGQTLSVLHKYSMDMMTPSAERDLCIFLTKNAAAPYMEAIQKWIFSGIIMDPYDEFMVVGNPRFLASKDSFSEEYWAKRYYIRKMYMPDFLSDLAIPILWSGKYLNVVRDCIGINKAVRFTEVEDLEYSPCGTKYTKSIEKAYKFSSKYLLDYIINDHKVVERVKTVKKYLLLQQGDFVVQLLDTCEEELLKPIPDILPSRLSTLVDMAVRTPSTNDDLYREDIHMILKTTDLSFQIFKILSIMTEEERDYQEPDKNKCSYGFEAFTLSLHCEWPVTLIMNDKILSAYQMLFRHLFYCKYIERLLSRVWQFNNKYFGKKQQSHPWNEIYTIAYSLRHKMIFWVQNILYYMTEEAIEPNWIEFLSKLERVDNVDHFMNIHWDFVNTCMDHCMLTKPSLLRIYQSLMATCKEYSLYVIDTEFFSNEDSPEIYLKCLNDFNDKFQELFLTFLKTIGDSAIHIGDKFLNILHRENYNNYFTNHLRRYSIETSCMNGV